MMAAATASVARGMGSGHGNHNRHASLLGLPVQNLAAVYGGMSSALGQRGGIPHGLKLDAIQLSGDFDNNGLRTAPPLAAYNPDFDFEALLFGQGSTINPNALHYSDSPPSLAMEQMSPYATTFNETPSTAPFDDSFDWLTGFENQMSFGNDDVAVVDGSSPSALSTTSQSGISDVMLDGSNHPAPAGTSTMWQASVMGPPQMPANPFASDLNGSVFPDLLQGAPLSPQPATQKMNDPYLSTPPPSMSSLSPAVASGLNNQQKITPPSIGHSSQTAPETPSSLNGGNHGASPVTTITDASRNAIVTALSQCSPSGSRKYSLSAGSPSSSHGSPVSPQLVNLPNTQDLQRYVGAYLTYSHPHMPFIHVPTLSFDANVVQSRAVGVVGSGCLMLSMAAIGALYEREQSRSKELFEFAKKMIFYYLEDRRTGDSRKTDSARKSSASPNANAAVEDESHTPVWLVQAMLINVIYGHNCGDKTASDIASTHCAALVSLAQAAELTQPVRVNADESTDIEMALDDLWNSKTEEDENQEWLRWKTVEERKRTLYGVFIMSSLLVSAYNHSPTLTNSEIHLDLPCDEEFFGAESSTAFYAMGGIQAANHNRMTFHDALGDLLRTNERLHKQKVAGSGAQAHLTDLKPSAFGSFILINALHNYIWETRQRHHNKIWTNEETEKMHRHIEPALKAWQYAWASNPKHSQERPNPYGAGPLSADAVPLLHLAYIRLFVNLSRSKEKFWQRDYEGMAEELAKGNEITQHAEQLSPSSAAAPTVPDPIDEFLQSPSDMDITSPSSAAAPLSSRRDNHLRKAASYAAESLAMSDKLGLTFADFNSQELPLQAAMCAADCAQVLAEWISTLQDRVGPYLGILGDGPIDCSTEPGSLLLDEEDVKLLEKIQGLVTTAEMRVSMEKMAVDEKNPKRADLDGRGGYATRILMCSSMLLDKAVVWPVVHLLARALETHAEHTRLRAEKSVVSKE